MLLHHLAYFGDNSVGPCGNADPVFTQFLNVTAGAVFPISWTPIVNHNIPPQPPGSIAFNYASGYGSTKFVPVATDEPIINQVPNVYNVKAVVIPRSPGYGTIQVSLWSKVTL